ncbi:hypothetical protein [Vitiosangium sp. GDMCC 1.1324]|uniref:hypothetical protein n=1 Tax=Vitiosangium sp. (strain GDMCC 1.1324) TaxID=2138576 RepID=UPI000D3BBA42|nr:hypothetical protein [Vitiosangium sp. GDMCC 1.1324]PTL81439.1 hypothetical protein DAT35_25410 [Vitiosangium sp. GDMCC 1.1324]
MANDITPLDIDVIVQMTNDTFATWSFNHKETDRDATQVRLFIGQEYQVTYQLRDADRWSIDAVSLRRVSDDPNVGFVTLTQGQTSGPRTLLDGAGTLAVEKFTPESVTLIITNTLTTDREALTVGLSLTVSANHSLPGKDSQPIPKQSSQDPQMVLEPRTVPPPPTGH